MPALGTPGFSGARLREARIARGLSAISLGEIVGVSRQGIWQYEHERTAPTTDRLYLLASRLNLPVEFFLQPPRSSANRVVFYRSQAAATKEARSKVAARMEWLGDIVSYLRGFVAFPAVDIPDLSAEVAKLPVRRPLPADYIESAATRVRDAWGLGDSPLPNMITLVEGHGAVTTRGIVETMTIDAFSVRLEPDDRPCLFLGSDKDSAARSRFDAAHELGHAVLHRDLGPAVSSPAERQALEADANRFASAFLLPQKGFAKDLRAPTLEAMLIAKSRWLTSVGAMIMRCSDLEILRPDEARRLWLARSKRGWNRREPLDEELPIEQPGVLRRAFDLLVSEGIRTPAQIVADVPLSPADIESLAGLPSGFFGDDPAPVKLLDRTALRALG